jgi:hypothetical protein
MAASSTYNQLLSTISGYIDKEKASGILERQLKAKNLAAETVASKDLAALVIGLTTAASLYVPDAGRKEDLKAKLKAMAG